MREYYVLFTCDAWKSHSSMKMVGVFTDKKLKQVIKQRIKQKYYSFGRDVKEINTMNIEQITNSLEYGYIEKVQINQEL